MSSAIGALRRRIITPQLSEVTLKTRGFHDKGPIAREVLETVGSSFLTGLGDAVETASLRLTGQRLEGLPARYRGFAYEGAAMGFALLDGLLPGNTRARNFISGPGDPHIYMAYIGVGWAMARLPWLLWPDIKALDPLLRWLVYDGYGFHQAYFHTGRYVHRRLRDHRAAQRTGDGPYALRAGDQGIGRALWFVAGADATRAVGLVDSFPRERRSDLYSGVGLAATYAGGADEAELRQLCQGAGEYRWSLAQGSAFAAEARVRSDLVVPECARGTRVLCGMDVDKAARLCRDLRPGPAEMEADSARPLYESWRVRLSDELARHGGGGS